MTDAAGSAAMTAWRQDRYGGPDAVTLARVPVPTAGPGEVLVKVRAASINAGDVKVMRGEPWLVRPMFGLRRPREATRGMDVTGTVVALGADVTGLAVGDEVMGEFPGGTLAEFVAGPAARLSRRPDALAPVDAAALPLAAGTAWQAIETARLAASDRVLVVGASGGVGHYAVQLAAVRGAEVWALCGARSRELVGELGAARTFDYRTTAVADLPDAAFDAVLDIAGTAPLRALRRLVRPAGSVVLVSGEGGRLAGPIGRIVRGILLSLTPGPRIAPLAAAAQAGVTGELAALAAAGRIRPVIERRFPLADAREALIHVDGGHTVGKVVVVV